jgi:hypothetical protein
MNFVDAKHGVRLVYSDVWKERGFLKPRQALILLTRSDEALSLVAQNNASKSVTSADLPAMEQRMIEKYRKEFADFDLLESADATLGGEPARRVVFTGKKLGMSVQVMNLLSSHAGTGYALMYMAPPASFIAGRADADEVIESVEFSK